MQGNRGRRDPFSDFSDPFAGFGSFGGFTPSRRLLSSVFGGRDPFDDPFFTHPFGGMFESNFFGPTVNPFPHMHPTVNPFPHMHPTGFIEHQAPEPRQNTGPIIEELNSDDEKDDADKEIKQNSNTRKHSRSNDEPHVEHPDDEEKKSTQLQDRNDYSRFNQGRSQPQSRSFAFQSSSVSYGGTNGVYYTSSKMRRTGSDGVTLEESKEADSSTGQAKHKVFRALQNKGHSLSRNLHSDGKVDSIQTLHNINEGELPGFEESWKGHVKNNFPGWTGDFNCYGTIGGSSSVQTGQMRQGGWALPSTESRQGMAPDSRNEMNASGLEHMQRMRTESTDQSTNHLRGKGVGRYY